ncbi:hypothetical protein Tco_0084498 [Tanacetum coccineum]
MQLKELMDIVPRLVTRIETLETELQQTKTTYGKAVLTLVKRVKILEKALKRKTQKVVISESEGEEPEDQGRIIQDIDDDISPTILEAAKTLSKVASQGVSKINIGRVESNTGIKEVSTGSAKVDSGTASKRGQREGKASMVEEDIQATHKTKEQIRQEEAGLEEAIKLKAQMDEEVAKQIHLDEMIAKRIAEEEAAKLEANAELTKGVLGKDVPEQYFAKRMVDMVNQRKKHFVEERVKAKRNKPMTQSHYKGKIEKVWRRASDKTLKKQKIDDKDVPAIGEKVAEVKEEEPVKRAGKRKKQKARKGINVDKSAQEDTETDKDESVEAMDPTPLTTKSDTMIKDFTREDLIELYRLVMQKYGTNRPEDAYDRVLWSDLRTMFDPPLNEDAIWSLPLQQKMVSWRYYDKCKVHCLTLEACTIYMLADRKYPLSKEACQVMLKMKLLDGKMNEVCYKLLKMIEKQAEIRK